jgi:anti-sigma factor RsiW
LSDHLPFAMLSALADGELSGEQLAVVNEHLASCPTCTSNALAQSLLKSAAARAGRRYTTPSDLRDRMARLMSEETARVPTSATSSRTASWSFSSFGWPALAALLLVVAVVSSVQFWAHPSISSESAEIATEACDQHVATLAANAPPEVISSDRHTVKPWFQGKLPFSFNLPEGLPGDTTLDGANLTYLGGQPTAQLIYSIGKHRVSVFVQQRTSQPEEKNTVTNRSGFHVTGFRTVDLDAVAVSDVDLTRLVDLTNRIERAQVPTRGQ